MVLSQSVYELAQATSAEGASGLENMNLFRAIVVGIVQGLTEFLPISSTAHVKVVPVVLGWGRSGGGIYSGDSAGQHCRYSLVLLG